MNFEIYCQAFIISQFDKLQFYNLAKSGRNGLNAEGIAKALPVVAPAARAGIQEPESEAAQKLPEIIQKFFVFVIVFV
ncbi:MAG: hypothetical protein IKN22_01645 [Bacteroidaceae bacterium]|nr:hypothetical protein [Bacteroidaceae bacterium]